MRKRKRKKEREGLCEPSKKTTTSFVEREVIATNESFFSRAFRLSLHSTPLSFGLVRRDSIISLVLRGRESLKGGL